MFIMLANSALADEKVYQATLPSTVWVLTQRASGTGFVFDAKQKLVATNYHVIRDNYNVGVVFPEVKNGELQVSRGYYRMNARRLAIKARVIASDPQRDLAILQLERLPSGVKALKLAAKNASPGQRVHSIGNPGASDALWVYTSGTVRQVYQKSMRMRSGFTVNAKVVETQSPINPGDSGGPVVNDQGELVGVSQSFRATSRLLSSSIAVSELKSLIAGNSKTMDVRVQQIVNSLKVPYTVSVFGNVRVMQKQSDGKVRAIFISNKSERFGSLELRDVYTTAHIFPKDVPQDVATLLLERSSRSPLAAWQIRAIGSRKYVVYSAKVAADTDAKTIGRLLDTMVRSAEQMSARIQKLEADRRAKAVATTERSVIGKWEVIGKSSSTTLPSIQLVLNADRTFQYRLANTVTLRGRYTFANRQLILTANQQVFDFALLLFEAVLIGNQLFHLIPQAVDFLFPTCRFPLFIERFGSQRDRFFFDAFPDFLCFDQQVVQRFEAGFHRFFVDGDQPLRFPDRVLPGFDLVVESRFVLQLNLRTKRMNESGSAGAQPGAVRQKALQEELSSLVDVVGAGPLVDLLLERSFQLNATDIHFDPEEAGLRVRLRVDGLLHDVVRLPKEMMPQVISRLKLMANMDITEKRLAQDGHIANAVLAQHRDIRVGSGPTIHGERIVLRLMPDQATLTKLEDLGLEDEQREELSRYASVPYGVILSVGPVGSGKSTTMYSCLDLINSPSKSLVTIEDPVERRVKGVNQIQIDPKIDFNFVNALRGVLRQDPNVIMVGEIRDPETAHIACRAGLTGVTVLSTLHANDTVATIDVFREFGIPLMFIADSLEGIVAQRLLRKICNECRTTFKPDAAVCEYLGAGADAAGSLELSKGAGCDACFNTGYFGRVGVFEILGVSGEIREAIIKGASHSRIMEIAVANGMLTLEASAKKKVLDGVTSLEEVHRVLTTTTESRVAGGNLFEPDRKKTRALKQARTLVKDGEYKLSLQILQKILDFPEDSLFYDDIENKTKFLSLKTEANRIIGSLPQAGRDAYELKYGILAKQTLNDALSAGNLRGVAEVARRYFHSDAGFKATYLMASFEMDRSNPLAAALQFDRLRTDSNAARRAKLEPMLSLKTAVCWGRAGMPEMSVKTLVDLRKLSRGRPVTIAGRQVPLFVRDDEALPWLVKVLGSQERFKTIGQEKWTMFRGNPSRTAVSAKASPVWDSLWSATTVTDAVTTIDNMTAEDRERLVNVQKRLKDMESKRKAANHLILPAAHPLIVDNMVISRSVRNIYANDLATGEMVWRTVAGDPAFKDLVKQATSGTSSTTSTLDKLLAQRAWRDQTAGTLSSDGRLVFSVEQNGYVNVQTRYNVRTTQTSGMDKFNKLMAFDVSSGKLIWEVGGTNSDEQKLLLAGTFFLGPPLPIGGRLFCLGETQGEIRLIVIDPDSNSPLPQPKLLWTQPLIHPSAGVDRVALRRMAGLSPSYSGGVLVCPTTAGAVVAIDPARRLLLWGYRYKSAAVAAPRPNVRVRFRQGATTSRNEDSGRWIDAAATIADSRIILTPRDSDELHCVSLIDGSLLWKQGRDGGLYVAAIHNGNVIVVGRNEVRALDLRDGTPKWKQGTTLPTPSGRGFQTEGYYHLPLSTGEIATINLTSGRLVARSKTRTGEVLGNLVSANGAIVSQSIDKIVGFKPFDMLRNEVQAKMKANPNSPEALAIRGEMRLHSGDEEGGLADLRRSIGLKSSPRARALVVASLLEGLRLDFAKYRSASPEIERLLLDKEQRSRYLRIYAAGLHEVGQHREAFSKYLQLAGPNTGKTKNMQINGLLSVRSDRWVQSRIAAIYAAAAKDQRVGMDKEIDAQFQAALKEASPEALRKFLNCFTSLPKGDDARRELVVRLKPDEAALEMEFHLRQLRQSADANVAAFATAQLAQLMLKRNQHDVVADLVTHLETRFADVKSLDGKTGREVAAELKKNDEVVAMLKKRGSWPKKRVFAERTTLPRSNYVRKYSVEFIGERGPYYENWSFELNTSKRMLVAVDGTGKVRWSLPNTTTSYSYYGNSLRVYGHLMVVTLGQRFLVLDTLTPNGVPKILWTRNLYETPSGPVVNRGIQIRRAIAIGGRQRVFLKGPQGQTLGMVGPVSGNMIVYQVAKTLYAVEPLTGAILWRRSLMHEGCTLFGDSEYIFAVSPQSTTQANVFRAVDGEKIGQRTILDTNSQLETHGRRVLNWHRSGNNYQLTYTDVFAGKVLWQKQFSNVAQVCLVKGDEVAVLEPVKAKFAVFNIENGKTSVASDVLPDSGISQIVVRRSDDHYVLLTNNPGRNRNNVRAAAVVYPNPMVSGYVYGFDRTTGKRIWTTLVENQSLDLSQPENLPVIVLASRIYVTRAVNQPGGIARRISSSQLAVDIIDIRNGQMVYSYQGVESANPYDMKIDPVNKTIDLKFYHAAASAFEFAGGCDSARSNRRSPMAVRRSRTRLNQTTAARETPFYKRKWVIVNLAVSVVVLLVAVGLVLTRKNAAPEEDNDKPSQETTQQDAGKPSAAGDVSGKKLDLVVCRIYTPEPGFTVFIDGDPVRQAEGNERLKTPCEVAVPKGPHQFSVAREGFRDVHENVNVKENLQEIDLPTQKSAGGAKSELLSSLHLNVPTGKPIPILQGDNAGEMFDPYIKPDGTLLYFAGNQRGYKGIYYVSRPSAYADFEREPRLIESTRGYDLPASPSLSSDSLSIVYTLPKLGTIYAVSRQSPVDDFTDKQAILSRSGSQGNWPSAQAVSDGQRAWWLYWVERSGNTLKAYGSKGTKSNSSAGNAADRTGLASLSSQKFLLRGASTEPMDSLKGQHPCLSRDGLRQYAFDGATLKRATRTSFSSPFSEYKVVASFEIDDYAPAANRRSFSITDDEQWLFYESGGKLYMLRVFDGPGRGFIARGKTIPQRIKQIAKIPVKKKMPEMVAKKEPPRTKVDPRKVPLPYPEFRGELVKHLKARDYKKAKQRIAQALADNKLAGDRTQVTWDREELEHIEAFWRDVEASLKAMKPNDDFNIGNARVKFQSYTDGVITAKSQTKTVAKPIREMRPTDLIAFVESKFGRKDPLRKLRSGVFLFYDGEGSVGGAESRLQDAGDAGKQFLERRAARVLQQARAEFERENIAQGLVLAKKVLDEFPKSQAAEGARKLNEQAYAQIKWVKQGRRTWQESAGAYTAAKSRAPGSLLRSPRQYENFELRVEWKSDVAAGQGGVYFRYPGSGNPIDTAFKIQFSDDFGIPADNYCTGALFKVEAPTANAVRKRGEWNTLVLQVRGEQVTATINGRKVLDTKAVSETIPQKGYVALDGSLGGITYRKILLIELP
eukprot:g21946.t1